MGRSFDVGCALGVVRRQALLRLRRRRYFLLPRAIRNLPEVFGPYLPSTARPLVPAWKVFTAVVVLGPKSPSTCSSLPCTLFRHR